MGLFTSSSYPVPMDAGDWIATVTALAGGVVALVFWGDHGGVPTSLVFVSGLVCGSILATAVLAGQQ